MSEIPPNPGTDSLRRFFIEEVKQSYSTVAYRIKDRCDYYSIKINVVNSRGYSTADQRNHAHRVAKAIRAALNECEVRGHWWQGAAGRLCRRCRTRSSGMDVSWWRENTE